MLYLYMSNTKIQIMKALFSSIQFYSPELEVTIIISEDNGVWGFERTDGCTSWGCIDYKTFDQAYMEAKKMLKNSIKQDKLEKSYQS